MAMSVDWFDNQDSPQVPAKFVRYPGTPLATEGSHRHGPSTVNAIIGMRDWWLIVTLYLRWANQYCLSDQKTRAKCIDGSQPYPAANQRYPIYVNGHVNASNGMLWGSLIALLIECRLP